MEGATSLQGPHQVAQKSTSTGTEDDASITSDSNDASVTSVTAWVWMVCRWILVVCGLHVWWDNGDGRVLRDESTRARIPTDDTILVLQSN
mmetsp:Transcript_10136/g.20007  ORF Transcript_10136/g.20007 Transcript_10136/m.20007 type:complete len:91 (+) Transcript_10136:323-595(+)